MNFGLDNDRCNAEDYQAVVQTSADDRNFYSIYCTVVCVDFLPSERPQQDQATCEKGELFCRNRNTFVPVDCNTLESHRYIYRLSFRKSWSVTFCKSRKFSGFIFILSGTGRSHYFYIWYGRLVCMWNKLLITRKPTSYLEKSYIYKFQYKSIAKLWKRFTKCDQNCVPLCVKKISLNAFETLFGK